jgi:hypothetical protein
LSIADASANQAAYQRTQWWDYAINANFINDVSNDCRINGIGAIVDPFGWASSLSPWTLQFLGCPAPGDAGALSYTGIIPAELMGHTFTNADLDVFSALYIQAIAETLTCGGPCPPNDGTLGPANDQPNFTNLPALTADQASVINAQIAYLQSMYGATNFNAYTESTCIDAGPDAAPDAPADSEGNAPADASDGG